MSEARESLLNNAIIAPAKAAEICLGFLAINLGGFCKGFSLEDISGHLSLGERQGVAQKGVRAIEAPESHS